ncbi:MAG: hypothetical protein R3F65_30445 [bacterium]
MSTDTTDLRHAITRVKQAGQTRFPPELSTRIDDAIAQFKAAGQTHTEIGRALGLSRKTIRNRLDRMLAHDVTASSMRPVVIQRPPPAPAPEPAPTPTVITLISPTGWRIEGLSIDAAARLLALLPC